jgi:hypothetical protein
LVSVAEGVLGKYIHKGYIYDFTFRDIDNDDCPDILFVGTNNDFFQAVLFVLDPKNIYGYSPSSASEWKVSKGSEKYYIRFPRSEIHIHELLNAAGRKINLLSNGLIEVLVEDGKARDNRLFTIFFYFDNKLQLKKISYDSLYKEMINELKKSGAEPA